MESPQLDLLRNTTNQHKKLKLFDHAKDGISFWVSILSVLIYVSVFYMFDLSPSSLLNTTKFWFFISNTLILIIAADFGAFTLSTDHDQQSYTYHHRCATTYAPSKATSTVDQLPPFKSEYITINVEGDFSPESESTDAQRETQWQRIADESESEELNNGENSKEIIEGAEAVNDQEEMIMEKREVTSVRRSSEKVIVPAGEEDYEDEMGNSSSNDGKVLRRTKSERRHDDEEGEGKQNEFSSMTDEELNRRVEEFIQMFNRQIRLQGARHRQMLASHTT